MVKGVAVAKAHRADGIPVISPIGGYKMSALGLAVLGEGLEDHFEACFHCGRSIIGEENAFEGRRESFCIGIVHQFLCQADGRFVSEAEKRGVGDLIQLGSDRLIDGGIAMSMEVSPDGRVAVEVACPVGTD